MVYVFLFTLGLIIGSFSFAHVVRTRSGKSIAEGRSKCDNCDHTLAAKDLVPLLSWLYLRGRCRYCKKSYGVQSPVVELIMAVTYALAYLSWPYAVNDLWDGAYFTSWILVLTNLVTLSVYDYNWKEIPRIYQTLNAGFCLLVLVLGLVIGENVVGTLANAILGEMTLFFSFLGLHVFSKGKWLGGADVYLVAPFGAVLGLLNGVISIILASYLALAFLIIGFVKLKKHELPFGPFLSGGFVLAFLYAEEIVRFLQS